MTYVIPREGTLMSIDALAIPKDAPHVAEAHKFIDFLLRPEIAARNTGVTNFANPVSASKSLLPPAIADNKAIYPDDVMARKLFTVSTKEADVQKIITREWSRVKLGR